MTKRPKTNVQLAHDGLPMDDSANAQRLLILQGDALLRYVPKWGRFIVWHDAGTWSRDLKDVLALQVAKRVAEEFRKDLPPFNPIGENPEHQWSKQSHMSHGLSLDNSYDH